MKNKEIEIWSDSFHEGEWSCSFLSQVALKYNCTITKTYINGFQPHYIISNKDFTIKLTVYGSYKSWTPIPSKIKELINWGKPDFIAYDASSKEILFAVEETAATPTGNQAMQRCERQYGSARFKIPYWYLISEYGVHLDGGVRRDSIWPTIAALKLSVLKRTPCIVLHYSDKNNPENYNTGKGVYLLFHSLFKILENHVLQKPNLYNLEELLSLQYSEMLKFLDSQWQNIIDFLPSQELVKNKSTPYKLANIVVNKIETNNLKHFLEWPLIKNVPTGVKQNWRSNGLIKYDPLCALFENDIILGNAYYLSNNAGSGKPPTSSQINSYIRHQKQLFEAAPPLNPPIQFTMCLNDFPLTSTGNDRRHVTTAKNIVYLYDSWNKLYESIIKAYPRLKNHLSKKNHDIPVFVYVSNSLKPGRIFGDPFTGQLSAYSTAFGKFDESPRMVIAYFPHQVHYQAIHTRASSNKGLTLMKELTDFIIFNSGVVVNLSTGEVM